MKLTVKQSAKQTEQMFRRLIRKLKDEKMMSPNELELIRCITKESKLTYSFDKDGNLTMVCENDNLPEGDCKINMS